MLSHSFDPRRVKSARTSTLALALKSLEREILGIKFAWLRGKFISQKTKCHARTKRHRLTSGETAVRALEMSSNAKGGSWKV